MKNRVVAALLALFLGGIGIHKFYLEEKTAGLLYLFFCWTGIPALLALIDSIRLLCLTDEEFEAEVSTAKSERTNKPSTRSAYETGPSGADETFRKVFLFVLFVFAAAVVLFHVYIFSLCIVGFP